MAKTQCYFISGSPPCWSVMLALEAKGVTYEPKRLSNSAGDQKSETFRAINPRGRVPVLVDGDVTVRETNAILAYLDRAYPEPSLFGSDPAQVAEIWEVVCEVEERLRTPIGNITRPIFRGRGSEMTEKIAETIKPVRSEMNALDARLKDRLFLAGETLSAADLVVYPALMQLIRGATRDGADVHELGVVPLDRDFPNLSTWAARIEAMPGYDRAYPPHWR